MKVLDKIEKKYGFKLPKMYRELAEAGKLDKELYLPDSYLMPVQDVLDFEWDDFLDPMPGLVPLAYNGAGEPYCWVLSELEAKGETAILAAMEGGEGPWFAPSVAGMIFRDALDWYNMMGNSFAPIDEIYERLPAVLELLKPYAPKAWCDTLRSLKDRPAAKEGHRLLTDKESDKLIGKFFGDDYVDHIIFWEGPDVEPPSAPAKPKSKTSGAKTKKAPAKKSLTEKTTAKKSSIIISAVEMTPDKKTSARKVPDYRKMLGEYEKLADLIKAKGGFARLDDLVDGATEQEMDKYFGSRKVPSPIRDSVEAIGFIARFGLYNMKGTFLVDGVLLWAPEDVMQWERDRARFVKNKNKKPDERVDDLWQKLFAFAPSPGPGAGSLLAVDPEKGYDSPVYRITENDDIIGHGAIVGETFESFFENWARVGFTHTDNGWLTLTDKFRRPLDANHTKVKDWYKWLKTK